MVFFLCYSRFTQTHEPSASQEKLSRCSVGFQKYEVKTRDKLKDENSRTTWLEKWGQFHQHAYVQLLRLQISKVQKDRQVISRKKVNQLVVLLYFSQFALYAVHSSLMKLTQGGGCAVEQNEESEISLLCSGLPG